MSEPFSALEKLDRREFGMPAHTLFMYLLILFLLIGVWVGVEFDRWIQFRRLSWIDLPAMGCAAVLALRGTSTLYRRLRSQ